MCHWWFKVSVLSFQVEPDERQGSQHIFFCEVLLSFMCIINCIFMLIRCDMYRAYYFEADVVVDLQHSFDLWRMFVRSLEVY